MNKIEYFNEVLYINGTVVKFEPEQPVGLTAIQPKLVVTGYTVEALRANLYALKTQVEQAIKRVEAEIE